MSLFRVPLNLLVVLCLTVVDRLAETTVYLICGMALLGALGTAGALRVAVAAKRGAPPGRVEG